MDKKSCCCRYCSNCVDGDGIICTVKNKSITEKYAKSYHSCKDFCFNEIDAFDESHIYSPHTVQHNEKLDNYCLFD